MQTDSYTYRFDNFLGETRNLVEKSKASVYFHLIYLRKQVWEDLKKLMDEYSQDGRRNWNVNLLKTQQDDFYILQFTNKYDESDIHLFFWKLINEENKMMILSLSLEKFRYIQSCLSTFANFSNMEFPWLGSAFLENIDNFVKSTFGADACVEFSKLIYDLEPIAGNGKPQPNLAFSPLSKAEILNKKQKEFRDSEKFFYIRWVKLRVNWKGETFIFSLSDESEILFEKGNLITFLEIVNALKNITFLHRSLAEKHLLMNVEELTSEEGTKTELRTIENLEVLKLIVDKPMTENWYENFTTLFSAPFKKDEKLMNFVLMKGNPYFLAQTIDMERGGSGVYLSATENYIKISPSGQTTNVSTVLKIIKLIQKHVDPNVTIAGA
jgi:hypothetical protein